ncbi:uncharacterized protein LOC123523373 [Mercenaria mercenaria]|uniref:uncharacterized protein LOC123523373 n=1 Tax=Mercenaria mercenaria TaxID=6596 RepID=UPI00234F734F|nr:uncharacterized protein LOC123523373 [Mercenaria mercenaria]
MSPLILLLIVFRLVYGVEKKLILHDETDITREILQLKSDVSTLKSENADLRKIVGNFNSLNQHSAGHHFIRWGRSECPGNGSEIIYRGYTAGSQYNQPGGGSNNLCLPEHPTFEKYIDSVDQWRGHLYGTEYENLNAESMTMFGYTTINEDVPCAVCKTTRSVLMIPGRADCYPGWTLEYKGYLMSAYHNYASNGDFLCVDAKPDFVPHGEGNHNDHLLYFVESRCGALPCPPYVNGRELSCVVCSI